MADITRFRFISHLRANPTTRREYRICCGPAPSRSGRWLPPAPMTGRPCSLLNEVYVGHRSHQSARCRLASPEGLEERQSSSGLLVGTGTGSTGWCRSAWQGQRVAVAWSNGAALCWFVREAWPSPATGTSCTEGLLSLEDRLTVTAEADLVVFGDGIESDTLTISWGQCLDIAVAETRLRLMR